MVIGDSMGTCDVHPADRTKIGEIDTPAFTLGPKVNADVSISAIMDTIAGPLTGLRYTGPRSEPQDPMSHLRRSLKVVDGDRAST
jgi:hypothetical protein